MNDIFEVPMNNDGYVVGCHGSIFTLHLDLDPNDGRSFQCRIVNNKGAVHLLNELIDVDFIRANTKNRLNIALEAVHQHLKANVPNPTIVCTVTKVQTIAGAPLHPHNGYLNHPSFHYSRTVDGSQTRHGQVINGDNDDCLDHAGISKWLASESSQVDDAEGHAQFFKKSDLEEIHKELSSEENETEILLHLGRMILTFELMEA